MTSYDEREKEKLYFRLLQMRAKNHKLKTYIKQCTKTSMSMAAPEFKDELKERHDFIMNDTKAIVSRGDSILRFLLRNLFNVDNEALGRYLDSMDELSKETLLYYANIVDIAGRLPQKHFDTIIESDGMTLDAVALLDNDKRIRDYLGFEEEFWQYLDDPETYRLRHLDNLNSEIIEHMSFVTPMLDDDGETLVDIIVQVPIVKNRETAMKAVDVYTRAYKYYKMIGKKRVKQSSQQEVEGYVKSLEDRAIQYKLKR